MLDSTYNKEAEAHRDALSNSNNIVYHEDWDDSEGPEWIDPVTTESNIAYKSYPMHLPFRVPKQK